MNEGFLYPDRVRFGSAIGERERTNFTANLEYRPAGTDHQTWFRYYWTEYTDDELRPEYTIRNRGDIGGINDREFFWTRYRIENETRHELQERPVEQAVLGGDFRINDAWRVEGNLNFTNAEEINPRLNYYETETQSDSGDLANGPLNNPVRFLMNSEGFATPSFNTDFTGGLSPEDMAFHNLSRFRDITSNVEEDTVTADLNFNWEGDLGGSLATVKTGIKITSREKMVDDQDMRYPYEGSLNLATAGAGDLFSEIGFGERYDLLSRAYTMPVPAPSGYRAFFNNNRADFDFDESSSLSNSIEDDYTMEENIYAAYVMASVDLSDSLNLTGGVRVERTDVDVRAFSFVDSVETVHPEGVTQIGTLPFGNSDILDTSGTHEYTNVLPSVMLRYELSEQWLMRASISTNIGRPDYPDTAPISTLQVTEDEITPGIFYAFNEIGNPDLEPFEAINYDISFDYYPTNNSGAISIGAFYKRIENSIYGFNEDFSDFNFSRVQFEQYQSTTLNNADPGHIQGVEFGIEYDFINLPSPLDGLGIAANTALIDSEVEVSQRPGEKLPFFNQADNINNVQLYYEKYGFQARLAWSSQSEAIFDEITGNAQDDIYRAERESIDLKITYQINDDLRVFFSGKNLNDEPDLTYRNGNSFFIAENPGYELYGREYRVGLTWALR